MEKKYVSLELLEKITDEISGELMKPDQAEALVPAQEVAKLIKRVYEVAEKCSVDLVEEDGE